MYAIVLWDVDSTFSTVTLKSITEPRKPIDEYAVGDRVLAPFGGRRLDCRIYEIGDNKGELNLKLNKGFKLDLELLMEQTPDTSTGGGESGNEACRVLPALEVSKGNTGKKTKTKARKTSNGASENGNNKRKVSAVTDAAAMSILRKRRASQSLATKTDVPGLQDACSVSDSSRSDAALVLSVAAHTSYASSVPAPTCFPVSSVPALASSAISSVPAQTSFAMPAPACYPASAMAAPASHPVSSVAAPVSHPSSTVPAPASCPIPSAAAPASHPVASLAALAYRLSSTAAAPASYPVSSVPALASDPISSVPAPAFNPVSSVLAATSHPISSAPAPASYPVPSGPAPDPYPIPSVLAASSHPISAPAPASYPVPSGPAPDPYPIPSVLAATSHPISSAPAPASYPVSPVPSQASHSISSMAASASHPVTSVLAPTAFQASSQNDQYPSQASACKNSSVPYYSYEPSYTNLDAPTVGYVQAISDALGTVYDGEDEETTQGHRNSCHDCCRLLRALQQEVGSLKMQLYQMRNPGQSTTTKALPSSETTMPSSEDYDTIYDHVRTAVGIERKAAKVVQKAMIAAFSHHQLMTHTVKGIHTVKTKDARPGLPETRRNIVIDLVAGRCQLTSDEVTRKMRTFLRSYVAAHSYSQ